MHHHASCPARPAGHPFWRPSTLPVTKLPKLPKLKIHKSDEVLYHWCITALAQLSRPGPLEPRESSWRPPDPKGLNSPDWPIGRHRIHSICTASAQHSTLAQPHRHTLAGSCACGTSHERHKRCIEMSLDPNLPTLYLFDMAFFMHFVNFVACPRLGHGFSCTGCLSRDQVLSSIHSLPLWFHLMNLIAYFRVGASCLCKSHISTLPACPFSVSPSWSSLSSIASILAFASSIIEIQQSSQSYIWHSHRT